LYGFLSVFVPDLSRFIFISPGNGDVDPFFPAVYLYFEEDNCTGKSYVDTNIRFQVLKVGSNYMKADDVIADCKDIKSWSEPDDAGGRSCRPFYSPCIPVLPYTEVNLPFKMPVALPLYFEY
jgi:hypothetical protein